MNPTRWKQAAALLAVGLMMAPQASGQETKQPAPASFDKLHKLMMPGPNESQWMQVSWMPSTDIYAARKKAADEGKPLLLWYMAGESLGTC
jgi:hypothetical protein